jgi:hypothetical protein
VISGVGRIGSAGQNLEEGQQESGEIGPEDTVWIEPLEGHWHGAGPDQEMTHLAINPTMHPDLLDDHYQKDWSSAVTANEYDLKNQGSGETSEFGGALMNRTGFAVLKFDARHNDLGDGKELCYGLSAVVQIGDSLWVTNDETMSLERLSLVGQDSVGHYRYEGHEQFSLNDYLDLPIPPKPNKEKNDLEARKVHRRAPPRR